MKKKILVLLLVCTLFITACGKKVEKKEENKKLNIDLTNLKMTISSENSSIKKYTIDDFDTFLQDYQNNKLPVVYLTEFLFDGVSMVKTYDLDDFIETGNDLEVKTLEALILNINTTGDIELTGEFTGMIGINTNGITDDINLILNGVNIDTDSKKVPALYVYNKDITYSDHKVTIKTTDGSKNYLEGGKLKKVSLLASDELDNYSSKYSGEASTWFNTYSNYYGVYTSEQVKNILFASVTADNEDLKDGDPYYFYKASGTISSDIDLYFEGTGYLEVTSKNKEGIESKANLELLGGTGDYVVTAQDDCLNTTTKSSAGTDIHNSIVINVKSLKTVVSLDADEGDAIDSNGTLTINGGKIYAFAHPGADAGLDAETGTTINGGEVIATGDMYDQITSSSKQNFMVLSFNGKVEENTLVVLLDENDKVVFSYVTDRSYSYLVYSSENLKEGTYYLYKNGEINEDGTYTKGTLLGYSNSGMQGGMGGQPPMNGDRPDMQNGERPELPDGVTNMPFDQDQAPMGKPDDSWNGQMMGSATNKEFKISGISNIFSGVAEYVEE